MRNSGAVGECDQHGRPDPLAASALATAERAADAAQSAIAVTYAAAYRQPGPVWLDIAGNPHEAASPEPCRPRHTPNDCTLAR
eukprot:2584869-Prymnesium_polylepis.1